MWLTCQSPFVRNKQTRLIWLCSNWLCVIWMRARVWFQRSALRPLWSHNNEVEVKCTCEKHFLPLTLHFKCTYSSWCEPAYCETSSWWDANNPDRGKHFQPPMTSCQTLTCWFPDVVAILRCLPRFLHTCSVQRPLGTLLGKVWWSHLFTKLQFLQIWLAHSTLYFSLIWQLSESVQLQNAF